MAKNRMKEVAKLLGVEIGEEFIIENKDRKETVVIAMDGFHVIQPNDVLGPEHGKLLSKVLQGLYEVKKKPWEPKNGEPYFFPQLYAKRADCTTWVGSAGDYALKVLGIVYRTREEASEHFAEDYEKLTGKKLEDSK